MSKTKLTIIIILNILAFSVLLIYLPYRFFELMSQVIK